MPVFVDTNILVYAEDRDAGSMGTTPLGQKPPAAGNPVLRGIRAARLPLVAPRILFAIGPPRRLFPLRFTGQDESVPLRKGQRVVPAHIDDRVSWDRIPTLEIRCILEPVPTFSKERPEQCHRHGPYSNVERRQVQRVLRPLV